MGGSAERTPKELATGDVVGKKFVVEKLIGSGGMGHVFAARHRDLGTLVAVKVIHVGRLGDKDMVTRFHREARAMAKLTSDHTVRVYDVGETDDGLPYLIMEHLAGRDLSTAIAERGPLSIEQALDCIIQACEAVAEAHDAGIVHRDLKPQNLFLSKKPSEMTHVCVLDFGLAKGIAAGATLGKMKATREGEILGTTHYMAPEQLIGGTIDTRTDIWALGATLFRLLTARHAFPGKSAPEVGEAIMSEPPVRVRTFRPEVPQAVESAILRCLEKDPERRFPNVRALRAELVAARPRPVSTKAPPAVRTATEPVTPSGVRRAKSPTLLLIAAVLVAAGIVATLIVLRRRSAPIPVALVTPDPGGRFGRGDGLGRYPKARSDRGGELRRPGDREAYNHELRQACAGCAKRFGETMVGLCPAFQPRIGVTFTGDGASLFHFAPVLDEIAESLNVPLLTSFADNREAPPDFDGTPEELSEAIGPWREWFSPTDGIRCVEGLLTGLEDPSVRARCTPGTRVIDDLTALHEVLLVAKKKHARFRLEIA